MKELSVKLTRRELIGGWIYFCIQLVALPFLIVLINAIFGNPMSEAMCNIIFFFVNFIVVAILFRKYLLGNLQIATGNPGRCLSSAFLGYAAYWLLNIFVSLFILAVKPDFANVNDENINQMMADHTALLSFATVVIVPVAEEVFFRGLMFGAVYNRNKTAAYLLTSLAFAAVHVIGYVGTTDTLTLSLCLLQYIPAGLCFGWAYARSNTLWAPILMHMFNNLVSISAMR